jgi:hypothetical protein
MEDAMPTRYRSADTGKYVKKATADKKPKEHVKEYDKPKGGGKRK